MADAALVDMRQFSDIYFAVLNFTNIITNFANITKLYKIVNRVKDNIIIMHYNRYQTN